MVVKHWRKDKPLKSTAFDIVSKRGVSPIYTSWQCVNTIQKSMFQMLLLSDAFAFSASGILVYKGSGKRVVKDTGHLYVVSCGGVASLAEFVTLLTERETQCKWASRHSVSSKLLHLSEVQPAGSAAFHSSSVHGAEVSAPFSCADVVVLSMVLH
jgi:hypothetical protein